MARIKSTARRHAAFKGPLALRKKANKRHAVVSAQPGPGSGAPPLKKVRWRPGTVVRREIRAYQRSTHLLIPRLPFSRQVRYITQGWLGFKDFRFTADALLAIQQSAEDYLTNLLTDCALLAQHAKRVTIQPKDMLLARKIRGDKCNWT